MPMARKNVLEAFKIASWPAQALSLIGTMVTLVVMASLKDTTPNSYSLWQQVLQNPLQPMLQSYYIAEKVAIYGK